MSALSFSVFQFGFPCLKNCQTDTMPRTRCGCGAVLAVLAVLDVLAVLAVLGDLFSLVHIGGCKTEKLKSWPFSSILSSFPLSAGRRKYRESGSLAVLRSLASGELFSFSVFQSGFLFCKARQTEAQHGN